MGKYTANQLYNCIMSEHTIDCNKCGKSDSLMMTDDWGACDKFFKDGWRVTPSYCYCPDCAKKYLKSVN